MYSTLDEDREAGIDSVVDVEEADSGCDIQSTG